MKEESNDKVINQTVLVNNYWLIYQIKKTAVKENKLWS